LHDDIAGAIPKIHGDSSQGQGRLSGSGGLQARNGTPGSCQGSDASQTLNWGVALRAPWKRSRATRFLRLEGLGGFWVGGGWGGGGASWGVCVKGLGHNHGNKRTTSNAPTPPRITDKARVTTKIRSGVQQRYHEVNHVLLYRCVQLLQDRVGVGQAAATFSSFRRRNSTGNVSIPGR